MSQQIKDNSISGKTVITNVSDPVVVPGFADSTGTGTLVVTGDAVLSPGASLSATGTLTITGSGSLTAASPIHGLGALSLSGSSVLSPGASSIGLGSLTLSGLGLINPGSPLNGVGSINLAGTSRMASQILLHGFGSLSLAGVALVGESGTYIGKGYPGNLSLPSGMRIMLDLANNGELVDITEDVDRFKLVLERNNSSGASTANLEFLSEPGQYDIYDTTRIFIDSDDPEALAAAWPVGWPNLGSRMRLFMGRTIKPSSTSVQPDEKVFSIQCVDNSWLEKFPPMNAGQPWPPDGTYYIDTVLGGSVFAGDYVDVIPEKMANITPDIDLYVTDPDGEHIEYIHVRSVNYPGQMIVTTPILAAGDHTVAVPDCSNIVVGAPYHIYNISDSTHQETIYPVAVSSPSGPGTITAHFVNSHKGDWAFMAGSFNTDFAFDHPQQTTTSVLYIGTFSTLQHIPVPDISFIQAGMKLTLSNADGTFKEVVDVISVNSGAHTFDAIVAWPKRVQNGVPWNVVAEPSLSGGPPDDVLIAGEWVQDVQGVQTLLSGVLYTFYDDSQSATVTSPISAGDQYVNCDTSNIFPGRVGMLCMNADGSGRERVEVLDIIGSSFRANFSLPKTAGWLVFNGPYIDKSGVRRVLPSVALAGQVVMSNGSVNFQGKSITQLLTDIEGQSADISTIVAAGSVAGRITAIPGNMYGLLDSQVGKRLWAQNADGSNGEYITIEAVSRTNFETTLTLSKSAGWRLFGKVSPGHSWSFNQDTPDHLAPWLPLFQYQDTDVRTDMVFRILTDDTVVDPSTGAQYGDYSINRDGSDHFNAVQVIGSNNSWARFVDWDSVNGIGGTGGDKQVMEGPIVVRQDLFTDDECYEAAVAIVSDKNFCHETPTLHLGAMLSPDLFHNPTSATLIKAGENGFDAPGKTLPVTRVRGSFDGDGVITYELELGDPPHEGLAHAVAGYLAKTPVWQPPYQATRLITKNGRLDRSATSYHIDTTSVSDDANLPRTVTLPSAAKNQTYHAAIIKSGLDEKRVHIQSESGTLIDNRSGLDMKPGAGPYQVYSDGRNYRTLQGFANPHNASSVGGDPLVITNAPTDDNPSGDQKLSIYHSVSGGVETTSLDFTGTDSVNGVSSIKGPQGQSVQQSKYGTGINDTVQFSTSNVVTTDHSIAISDRQLYFPVDCTGGPKNLNLPQVIANQVRIGTTWFALKSDDTNNSLSIVPFGSELINGVNAPFVLSQRGYAIITLQRNSDLIYSWAVQSIGGGAGGGRFNAIWNTDGSLSFGRNFHYQVPRACRIVRALLASRDDVVGTGTVTVRFERYTDANYPIAPDISNLDNGNLSISGVVKVVREGVDLSGWTVDLALHDWVVPVVTVSDIDETRIVVVLEFEGI